MYFCTGSDIHSCYKEPLFGTYLYKTDFHRGHECLNHQEHECFKAISVFEYIYEFIKAWWHQIPCSCSQLSLDRVFTVILERQKKYNENYQIGENQGVYFTKIVDVIKRGKERKIITDKFVYINQSA